ncbi:MAG TPA: cyclohexanecarboxylate-CoA ligase, partial [Acidimicrobiales bacterium]|nr:cyclohexanecarboxylate-CoA ligase [Acidimicrobiales bacterium]
MFFETTLTTARIGASRGFWADRRLQEFLDEAVLEDPTRTATVDARGRLTFGELAEQTDLVASALLDLGVRPGDVVGAQLPNWNEFVVLM